MAESFIQNGNFSQGFTYWQNGIDGQKPFYISSARATGSALGEENFTYKMRQAFTVTHEVISAKLWVYGYWQVYEVCPGEQDGRVKFTVKIRKPDLSLVNYGTVTKEGVGSGNGWIQSNVDVTAALDVQGTYYLELTMEVRGGFCSIHVERETSIGQYDDVSIYFNIKIKKTVIEKIGGGESIQAGASVEKAEAVGLTESHSQRLGIFKTMSESIGIAESFIKKVKVTVLEALGAAEDYHPMTGIKESELEQIGLAESYSFALRGPMSVSEQIGLTESLSARKFAGNTITNIAISDVIAWDTIPKVTTRWIKTKTVIN